MGEGGVVIRVEPLDRAVLDGVADGEDDDRRRLDVGLLPYFSDERPLQGLAGFVDWRSSGRLSSLLREGLCSGVAGEVLLLPGRTTLPVDRLVLVGLGDSHEFDRERAREAARAMVGIARGLRAFDVLLAMPGRLEERSVSEAVFTALTEALRAADGGLPAHEAEDEGEAVAADEATGEPDDGADDGPARNGAEHWWVVAEPRHVSRLRRLLDGPPRPADPA